MKLKSLLNLTTLASDPAGSEGDVFFNTTEKALKIHNGAIWVIIASNTDPAFADAVFLHISALLVVEADADVMLENGRNMVGAARICREVVGQCGALWGGGRGGVVHGGVW